ncbi:MAG: cyclic lactone autoinducer peptide [Clostridia bacterium]|nr:cyclic lactone autoinducer peptide [Clostridia bacterium]
MKKIIASLLCSLLTVFALATAASASIFIGYQPRLPKSLR